MNPAPSAEPVERPIGHPIIWNGLILGVLSGAFLSATAYYKIVAGEESAVIAFAPLVAVAWIVAGFRASKRAISTKSGVAAGLLAGVVGAAIGAAVDQVLAHQFINQWVTQLNAGCDKASAGYFSCVVDAPTQLAREWQATVWGLVALPIVGLICGLIAGFVGSVRGARDIVGDEYEDGTVTVHPPLISGHRTLRSQGMDFPQTDRPTV